MTSAKDYEGRNLPELMELMQGLVRPEPVSMLPQTPAWWVLLGWLLALALLVAVHRVRRRRANRYRREALDALHGIESDPGLSAAQVAAKIADLLKRTALAAYPRSQVASLCGEQWAAFLCQSAPGETAIEAAAPRLAVAAYCSDTDGRALIAPARRWIEVHRA